MKFKYISRFDAMYKGQVIKSGDVVESDNELSSIQYEKIEEVETPKKVKKDIK